MRLKLLGAVGREARRERRGMGMGRRMRSLLLIHLRRLRGCRRRPSCRRPPRRPPMEKVQQLSDHPHRVNTPARIRLQWRLVMKSQVLLVTRMGMQAMRSPLPSNPDQLSSLPPLKSLVTATTIHSCIAEYSIKITAFKLHPTHNAGKSSKSVNSKKQPLRQARQPQHQSACRGMIRRNLPPQWLRRN